MGQLPEDLELIRHGILRVSLPYRPAPSSSSSQHGHRREALFSSVLCFRVKRSIIGQEVLPRRCAAPARLRDDSPTIGDVWSVSNISWSLPLSLLLRRLNIFFPLVLRSSSQYHRDKHIHTHPPTLSFRLRLFNCYMLANLFHLDPLLVACVLSCVQLQSSIYCYRSNDVRFSFLRHVNCYMVVQCVHPV